MSDARTRFRIYLAAIGVAAVCSVAALVILVVFAALRGNAWHIVSCTIFGVTLILLYLAATIVSFWRLRIRLKNWVPFSATLAELKKDKACLEEES